MKHSRFFVETAPDAVPAVVFHHAEVVLVGDVLDGATDVGESRTRFACRADSNISSAVRRPFAMRKTLPPFEVR
jgi:hypothetical protein